MTQLTENIFAIQVPVDSYEHFINRDIIYWDSESNSYDFVELPPGNYSFICASLNCSEMDAAQITVSKKQLLNLLSKRGLNPELNYAILENNFNYTLHL